MRFLHASFCSHFNILLVQTFCVGDIPSVARCRVLISYCHIIIIITIVMIFFLYFLLRQAPYHHPGPLSRNITYLITYSMVQSPSWEANWFAASQEIPRISRNPKIHYRTHKRPPLSLSWASPIQSIYQHPTSWRSILILSTHLRLGLPSGLLSSGFPSKTV